jgi:hypothetical protein
VSRGAPRLLEATERGALRPADALVQARQDLVDRDRLGPALQHHDVQLPQIAAAWIGETPVGAPADRAGGCMGLARGLDARAHVDDVSDHAGVQTSRASPRARHQRAGVDADAGAGARATPVAFALFPIESVEGFQHVQSGAQRRVARTVEVGPATPVCEVTFAQRPETCIGFHSLLHPGSGGASSPPAQKRPSPRSATTPSRGKSQPRRSVTLTGSSRRWSPACSARRRESPDGAEDLRR